jgi:undecaprenyl-phosphate galactose phosphotransferase
MIANSHKLIRTDPKFKKLFEEYKKNYKLDNDPRVTTIGKFLRKTSIDEFPQFFNVLKGEMSIVGPRAYYPDELEEQKKKFPGCEKLINEALKAKPGITGLWQVSGRSRLGFEKRIALDARYANARSLLLDLKIILKTPFAVINGEGTKNVH